jgi:peptide/nickel transport system ATP-binding protein
MSSFPSISGERRVLTGIPGSPPDMLRPPTGCRFHPRCAFVQAEHRTVVPKLREVANGHFVACHLYNAGLAEGRARTMKGAVHA